MTTERGKPLPYYRWYVRDYRQSRRVQELNWMARGIYRELLDECWDRGYIPDDPVALSKICRVPAGTLIREWKQLRDLFDPVENMDAFYLTSTRLEVERTKEDKARVQRSLAGKASAEKRNARQRPLNARYIAVNSREEQLTPSTAVASEEARPVPEQPISERCSECGSRGAALLADVHAPGCRVARAKAQGAA